MNSCEVPSRGAPRSSMVSCHCVRKITDVSVMGDSQFSVAKSLLQQLDVLKWRNIGPREKEREVLELFICTLSRSALPSLSLKVRLIKDARHVLDLQCRSIAATQKERLLI